MILKQILHQKIFWIILGIIVIITFFVKWRCDSWIATSINSDCSGFVDKTIWDLFGLIIIPLTIAGVVIYSDWVGRKADTDNANIKAEIDQEIAQDNQYEESLQNYFNILIDLLLVYKIKESHETDDIRTVARVKNKTVLEKLDGHRKSKIIAALCALGLVQGESKKEPIISLYRTNLNGIELIEADLRWADLFGVQLEGANISCSNLENTRLEGANLKNAKLLRVKFNEANLGWSDLRGADLDGANLYKANLDGATLNGAKITQNTIMPDGKKYDPTIHTLEMFTDKSKNEVNNLLSSYYNPYDDNTSEHF